MSALEIRGLRRTFGDTVALDGVDLEIPEGTLTAVLGPSGCGKTTLLRIVVGFLRAEAGTVQIAGRLVTGDGRHERAERRRVGYVPQEGALFPHQTVAANIAFGLPRRERGLRHRVDELLELVGLESSFASRRPDELSGGQQQRVALARALAPKPSLVLLDEPFASLDARLRENTGQAVGEVLRETGATGLLVTHDQAEALSLADRIAVMDAGRILQHGAPQDVYAEPLTRTVADFLGGTVLLPAEVRDGVATCALGRLPVIAPVPPEADTVLVRPEQLELVAVSAEGKADEAGTGPRARVAAIHFFGHDADVQLRLGDRLIVARLVGTDLPAVGQEVGVRVRGPVRTFGPGRPETVRAGAGER